MPLPLRRIAALTVALALAAAAPAGAQSAGDDQYEDPFAGEQDQTQGASGGGGNDDSTGGGDDDTSGSAAPDTPAPAADTDTATAAPAPAPAAPAAEQLPYTGADAGLLGLGGALLLAGGIAIRVRLRDQR